jgi:2',3'-cyclic-nucleotide 2'-phosphodiesterase (5'-nucleotidase family)
MRASFKDVVLVDAGDAFGGRSESEKRKAEVVLRSMGLMGYDAFCVGESELEFGTEFLLDAARETKVPLVGANLVYYKTRKTVVQPYVIAKRAKVKVGIVGLLDDVLIMPEVEGESDSVVVLDPIETAKKLIPPLKKKVDVVVVLAHMGLAKSTKLANEVPEIDVLVSGHNPGVSMETRKEGNALLMMSGSKGQYVGRLVLKLGENKGIVSSDGTLVSLDGRIRESKLVNTVIQEYNTQEKKLTEERMRQEQEASLSRAGEDHYLGQETCKRCHEEVYQKLAKMDHARAYETLTKTNSEGLAECLVCHTTGYGEPTGFGSSSSVDLKNVQCESCHGMGSRHKRDGSYKQVSEQKCLACHTKERSPGFNYNTYLKKTSH